METLALLRGHYLFDSLDDSQTLRLEGAVQRVSVLQDGHLFHFGDPAVIFIGCKPGKSSFTGFRPQVKKKSLKSSSPGKHLPKR